MLITTLPLSQGKETIIDKDDYNYLSQWKWYVDHYGYARTTWTENGRTRKVKLHRLIMEAKESETIDHINGNTLDNRRSNLRICTQVENMQNRRKQINNTSGYKGVYWHKQNKCWMAKIQTFGIQRSLGSHKTAKDAAKAYDIAALKHLGEFASFNLGVPS